MGGRFEDCLWESLVCLLLSASSQNLSSSYVRFANNRPPRLVKYIMSFTDFENLEGVAIGRIVDRKTQSTCGLNELVISMFLHQERLLAVAHY